MLDLSSRKQSIMRAITEKQMANLDVTAQELKEQFSGNQNLHNFFEFAEQFISEVKNKRSPMMEKNYRKLMYKLEKYHHSKILSFEQINHDFLVKFEEYL